MSSAGPSSSSTPVSRQRLDINRNITFRLTEVMLSDAFNSKFKLDRLDLDAFSDYVLQNGENYAFIQHLQDTLRIKALNRLKKTSAKADGLSVDNVSSKEVSAEYRSQQVRQLVSTAHAIALYASSDRRTHHFFRDVFENGPLSLGFLTGGSYIQMVLANQKDRTRKTIPTIPATPMEVMLFYHALSVVHEAVLAKHVSAQQNYWTGNRIGIAVQTLFRAYSALTQEASAGGTRGLGNIMRTLWPYIRYDPARRMFAVLTQRLDGFSDNEQLTTASGNCALPTVHNEGDVHADVWSRTPLEDRALRLLADLFFKDLKEVVKNQVLFEKSTAYSELSQWNMLKRFELHDDHLPLRFCDISRHIYEPLSIERPAPELEQRQPPVNDVPEAEENEIQPAPSPIQSTRNTRRKTRNSSRPLKKRKMTVSDVTTGDEVDPVPLSSTDNNIEDVVADLSIDDLSEEGTKARETLLKAMEPYCVLVESSYDDFLSTMESEGGRALPENVQLLLTDPPYNTRSSQGRNNSSYDIFTSADMRNVADIAKEVLCPGGHGHIFCSGLQFMQWSNALRRTKETVTDYAEDPAGNTSSEVAVFPSESNALHYVRSPGNYNSDPRTKRLHHMSMVDQAVHFWRNGPTHAELLAKTNYSVPPETCSSHPLWTNVIVNVERLQPGEVLYRERGAGPGAPQMLRPEQKSTKMLRDVIRKFTQPGDLVMDLFSGTAATAKACLSLDEHRRFVGCDIDGDCVNASMDSVLDVFAAQAINPASDITLDIKGLKAARVFIAFREQSMAKTRRDKWTLAPGLYPVQTFPPHVLQYLSSYFMDYSLQDNLRNVPPSNWSRLWRQRLESADTQSLLSVECNANSVAVQPSRIRNPGAGMGLFATKNFGYNQVVGYYYGSLVYSELSNEPQRFRTYSDGVMGVTAHDFEKWSIKLDGTVQDKSGNNRSVWIVPAPWCAARFINDARYRNNDTEKNLPDKLKRKVNLKFIVQWDDDTPRSVAAYNVVELKTTQNIRKGEEFYIDYGSNYDFRDN